MFLYSISYLFIIYMVSTNLSSIFPLNIIYNLPVIYLSIVCHLSIICLLSPTINLPSILCLLSSVYPPMYHIWHTVGESFQKEAMPSNGTFCKPEQLIIGMSVMKQCLEWCESRDKLSWAVFSHLNNC